MDEFRKHKLIEQDEFDLFSKWVWHKRKFTKWAKKKSNHIARMRLKEEMKNESEQGTHCVED